jgi:hypothetical protein
MSTGAPELLTLDGLIAEARAAHRPGYQADWLAYERLKKRLRGIYAQGTPEFEQAIKQIVDAPEGSAK